MNGRAGTVAGRTRVCPHCKSTILESASVCPGCNHHLRFDNQANADQRAQPRSTALKVDGSFRNPEGGRGLEYSVVVSIRNERGEEVARKVIGVGALDDRESRTVTLAVEVSAPSRGVR
ncbi:MAG TPA: hypothetical protein VMF52_00855 [Steroidobacteraceae bacterium]|nr:hypothetical protein [Steroidobacteraceae bacterium]